ncbi:MAG TPA: helix-turn-helix domain-containing protein [Syntrophales bacterium]|nr:helix-turn-helix domain-containing protein [Syntrophales bacterium]
MARKTQTDKGLQKAHRIDNPVHKRLFTLQEGAEYLGRSVWGMRDLIWKREIPVVKEKGARKQYLDKTDLDEWINKNKAFCS